MLTIAPPRRRAAAPGVTAAAAGATTGGVFCPASGRPLGGPGEWCLLGRKPAWPEGRYSTLAGFVEVGEPLELTVAREVWALWNVDVG
eukprot:357958-Chlamydomonas_euryale.AAC.2